MAFVLITGRTGFIGSYLARSLVKKGKNVVLFDAFSVNTLIEDIERSVQIIKGNLSCLSQRPVSEFMSQKLDLITLHGMVDEGGGNTGRPYRRESIRIYSVSQGSYGRPL